MLPFGGPPGFPLMSQSVFPQQVLLNPLNRGVMVTSAPTQLISHGVVAAQPPQGTTVQAPMLVPPAMQAEIAAAAKTSPNSSSSTPAGDHPVWTQHTAQDGKVYYYNRITKQSSWTKPDEKRCAWREYKTPEGKSYYYNVETKSTTWSLPEGEEFEPAKESKASASAESMSSSAKGDSKEETAGNSDLEKAMMATLAKYEQSPVATSGTEQQSDSKDVAYDYDKELKKRQGDRFRELLRDKYNDGKISSNCSWDHAVKYVQHDPRFRIISKMSEKKQLFNAWKTQKQKEEREEKRLAIKKSKDDFEEWLKALPKMKTQSFRYSKAEDLYGSEPVWRNVAETDRRDIFRDVKEYLEKAEEEKSATLRRRNIQALDDILQGMPEITFKTTWAQAQRLLIENPAFAKDATLQGMDKEDALIVFEEHIRNAEKVTEKEKEDEEKSKRRRERKVREGFLDLLKELQRRGELSSVSKWKDLCPTLIADYRFDDLLHQEGTTALDLFKFYVEDLKAQFGQDRRIMKDILKDLDKCVEKDTTFDEFSKWVASDERGKTVDMGNMKLVYNSYVDKAIGKEKDIERELERKKKRLESNFHSALKRLEPPVTPSSEWPKKDEQREEFFNDFVKTISEACGHYHSSSKKKKKDRKKRRNDDESESEGESKSKRKRRHRSSDEADRDHDRDRERERDHDRDHDKESRKKKKKSRRHSRSRSRSRSESPDGKSGSKRRHRDRHDSSSSKNVHEEESFDDLEMKRNELLQQLERSHGGDSA
ncbi:hypothetical protein QR680_012787 [Steinernema hermaphroditum]|uniref:Pre-mRNA-processing factor 40 homolog B n=1 Tax=Steinernema hermaphroditum TaxID=289476 RepID=A0AA39I606_9BILA|nr:hypothetical protein QR680_012787 [Steinernema hermaphroditum]